jgi:hypothetical protein
MNIIRNHCSLHLYQWFSPIFSSHPCLNGLRLGIFGFAIFVFCQLVTIPKRFYNFYWVDGWASWTGYLFFKSKTGQCFIEIPTSQDFFYIVNEDFPVVIKYSSSLLTKLWLRTAIIRLNHLHIIPIGSMPFLLPFYVKITFSTRLLPPFF